MAGLFDATFRRRLAGGTDRRSMAVVSPVIGVALISARFLPARTSCGYRGVTSRGRAMLSGSVMSGWAVLTRWSEGWSVSDPVTSDPVTAGPGAVTAGPKCLVGSHNARVLRSGEQSRTTASVRFYGLPETRGVPRAAEGSGSWSGLSLVRGGSVISEGAEKSAGRRCYL